jgi:ribosomal protein S18 acetylase RimI-like enzyme
MTPPEIFAAPATALALPGDDALVLAPLAEADAHRLGEAFARIDPWAAYGYPATGLVSFLAAREPGVSRLALVLDQQTVGASVIRADWLRGPYLQFLAVLPDAQRRGIGAAFLAWMEREARAANERNLWVAASQINTGAIRFYERQGFTEVAKLDGLVADGFEEILFRKRLG